MSSEYYSLLSRNRVSILKSSQVLYSFVVSLLIPVLIQGVDGPMLEAWTFAEPLLDRCTFARLIDLCSWLPDLCSIDGPLLAGWTFARSMDRCLIDGPDLCSFEPLRTLDLCWTFAQLMDLCSKLGHLLGSE